MPERSFESMAVEDGGGFGVNGTEKSCGLPLCSLPSRWDFTDDNDYRSSLSSMRDGISVDGQATANCLTPAEDYLQVLKQNTATAKQDKDHDQVVTLLELQVRHVEADRDIALKEAAVARQEADHAWADAQEAWKTDGGVARTLKREQAKNAHLEGIIRSDKRDLRDAGRRGTALLRRIQLLEAELRAPKACSAEKAAQGHVPPARTTVDHADASPSPRTQAQTTPSSVTPQPFVGLSTPGRVPPAMPYTEGSPGLVDPSKKGSPPLSTSTYLLTPQGVPSPNAVTPLERPSRLRPKMQGAFPPRQSSPEVLSNPPGTPLRRGGGPRPRIDGSPHDQHGSEGAPSLQPVGHLQSPSSPGPKDQGFRHHPMFPPERRSYTPAGDNDGEEAKEIAGMDKVPGVPLDLTAAEAGRCVDDAAVDQDKSQATLQLGKANPELEYLVEIFCKGGSAFKPSDCKLALGACNNTTSVAVDRLFAMSIAGEGHLDASKALAKQQDLEERARQEEEDWKVALQLQEEEHNAVERPAKQQTDANSAAAARRGVSDSANYAVASHGESVPFTDRALLKGEGMSANRWKHVKRRLRRKLPTDGQQPSNSPS